MRRLACALIAATASLASPAARAEENAMITGTGAGPACSLVAVGIVRQSLRYPLLGASGWSRGVPTVTKNVAELWLLDRRTDTLRRALSIPSPRQWTDATRYHLSPRVLPDESVVYTLHGCARENPNCTDAATYLLAKSTKGGKPKALPGIPPVSPEESAHLHACTTYLTYTERNEPQVSVGPTGGPWQPVLAFKQRELALIR